MFSISYTIKKRPAYSAAFFEKVSQAILGKNYDLSVVFVGDTRSKKLNTIYRDKKSPTDVLSFPIEDNAGELYINLNRTLGEAKKFNHTPKEHLLFVFIHGCLHLKGFDHGTEMEKQEDKFMKKFL